MLDEERVRVAFLKMAAVVDEQNLYDPTYVAMAADTDRSLAYLAALEIVFSGRVQANGYTESTLNKCRSQVKA